MAHLTFEIIENNQFSSDQKKFKTVDGTHHEPWASTEEMLAAITTFRRHLGQEFEIIDGDGISTYHFVGGIADEDLVKESSSSDGGTGENFANTDLTATGDRIHDFEGYAATIKGLSEFNLEGGLSEQTIDYVAGGDETPPFFMHNFDGVHDGLVLDPENTSSTITAILNVDGTNTSPITFTLTNVGDGEFAYIAPKQTGTTITCVSYSGMLYQKVQVSIEAESVTNLSTDNPPKMLAIFDGNIIKKSPSSYLDSQNVDITPISDGTFISSDDLNPGILSLNDGFSIKESIKGGGGAALEIDFSVPGTDIRVIDPSSAYTTATINLNVASPITGNKCMLIVGQGTLTTGATAIISISAITTAVGIIMDNAAPTSAKAGDIFEWTFIKTTEVGDNGVWHRTK